MLSRAVLFTLLGSVLVACTSVQVEEEIPVPPRQVLAEEYRIGVNDDLQVDVWRNPELSLGVTVRPDGKISVPLVGDTLAAGKTAEQLAAELTRSLASFVRQPEVTVIVANPNSAAYLRTVKVTGAVNTPQSLAYAQGMTILDVVLAAGGVTDFGAANGALLYRQTPQGVKVYPVYLKDILEKGRLDTNYPMAPADVLTVPERKF